MVTITRTR